MAGIAFVNRLPTHTSVSRLLLVLPAGGGFYESDLSKVREEETRAAENGDGKKRLHSDR
jgi:hypothetical protein